MKNQRTYVIAAVIVIMIVVAGMIAAYFIMRSNAPVTNTDTMPGMDHSKASMNTSNESETYKKYATLKGEEYDKVFLADMVVHHDSALNMSEMANGAAKHEELRTLVGNINVTQGQEIANMNALQEKWGYQKTSGHQMSGGNMEAMEGMVMEGDALRGLSGDEFDKKFLELMIKHHEDAIEMSRPAASNASRQEIKDLAQAIITAQTKEIVQMQQWQRAWGYVSA